MQRGLQNYKFQTVRHFRNTRKSLDSSQLKIHSSKKLKLYEDLEWSKHSGEYEMLSQLNIMTFNLLAPCYKRMNKIDITTGFKKREASFQDLWYGRATKTRAFLSEEVYGKIDIIAFQEYWLNESYTELFQEDCERYGYELHILQRTGKKLDAVALMIRKDSFEVLNSQQFFLCSLGDRVALLLWLRHRPTQKNILVANTHLTFPHSDFDRSNQIRQMSLLMSGMDEFANKNSIQTTTRIILGDFNVESNSPVCEALRENGYYSCFEVKPPENPASLQQERPPNSDRGISHKHEHHHRHYHKESKSVDVNSSEKDNSSTPGQRVKFISHRTHNNEDLGVDHIFIRPGHEIRNIGGHDAMQSNRKSADFSLNLFSSSSDSTISRDETVQKEMHQEFHVHFEGKNGHSTQHGMMKESKTSTTLLKRSASKTSEQSESFRKDLDLDNSSTVATEQSMQNSSVSSTILSISTTMLEWWKGRTEATETSSRGPLPNETVPIRNAAVKLFVDESIVLPRSLPCDRWHPDFLISDHRPVSVRLVIGQKEIT